MANPSKEKLLAEWRQWLDDPPALSPEELSLSLPDRLPQRTPVRQRVIWLAVAASLLLCAVLLVPRMERHSKQRREVRATPVALDTRAFELPHEDFLLVWDQEEPIYVALPDLESKLRRQ